MWAKFLPVLSQFFSLLWLLDQRHEFDIDYHINGKISSVSYDRFCLRNINLIKEIKGENLHGVGLDKEVLDMIAKDKSF